MACAGGNEVPVEAPYADDATGSDDAPVLPQNFTTRDSSGILSRSPKQYRAKLAGRKMSVEFPKFSPSTTSFFDPSRPVDSSSEAVEAPTGGEQDDVKKKHRHHVNLEILDQVKAWMHEERTRIRHRRGLKSHHHHYHRKHRNHHKDGGKGTPDHSPPPSPDLSDSEVALGKLEKILMNASLTGSRSAKSPALSARDASSIYLPRKKSSVSSKALRKIAASASSDTEYVDGDAVIPHADVHLDNSRTMGFGGGKPDSAIDLDTLSKKQHKERDGWIIFKNDIIRLAHTLRLKGWRRVPLDAGVELSVDRLSGALTNAVYVVSPPDKLPPPSQSNSSTTSLAPRRPPPKLLLRVYGPQTGDLIDREKELEVLRRLARQRIGPRLLGTFENGRFEQFFFAKPLTAPDLRNPDTSRQIAKRMKELHQGIELLREEREAGPFVWQNWDSWVGRCEEIVTRLDEQVKIRHERGVEKKLSWRGKWMCRGYVCGTEWSFFRRTVETYREWLKRQYGGDGGIKERLVFAHNDTQYGNILRLEPNEESPLLLAANEHKRLIVIDFEYANANLLGLEFANHFTEWCYNYHSPTENWACKANRYPSPAEQTRFLEAYIQHRPYFLTDRENTPLSTFDSPVIPSLSPAFRGAASAASSSFELLPASAYVEDHHGAGQSSEKDIEMLKWETRMWRVANHAQWVAWGLVQANVEDLEVQESTLPPPVATEVIPGKEAAAGDKSEGACHGASDTEHETEEGEFDYLAYAQDRAMFFWGDVVCLGIVKDDILPEHVRRNAQYIKY